MSACVQRITYCVSHLRSVPGKAWWILRMFQCKVKRINSSGCTLTAFNRYVGIQLVQINLFKYYIEHSNKPPT